MTIPFIPIDGLPLYIKSSVNLSDCPIMELISYTGWSNLRGINSKIINGSKLFTQSFFFFFLNNELFKVAHFHTHLSFNFLSVGKLGQSCRQESLRHIVFTNARSWRKSKRGYINSILTFLTFFVSYTSSNILLL